MNDKIRVLFLCVHNAARSRMAEALLRELGGERFEVTSAGFDPQPADMLVVQALARAGIELPVTRQQPSVFELYRDGRHFNYVITVCDEELGEKCPLFPGVTQRLSWSFPDPRSFVGSQSEKVDQVTALRDTMRKRIEQWMKTLSGGRPETPQHDLQGTDNA